MTGTYFVKITDDHRLLVNDRELAPSGIAPGDSEALLAWALDRVAQAHMSSGGTMTLNVFDYREGGYGSQSVALQPGTVVGIEELREASRHVYAPPMALQDAVEVEEPEVEEVPSEVVPEDVEGEDVPDDQGLAEESEPDHVKNQESEPEHLMPGEDLEQDDEHVDPEPEQWDEAGKEDAPTSGPEVAEPEPEDAPLPVTVTDEPEDVARAHPDAVAEEEFAQDGIGDDTLDPEPQPEEPVAVPTSDPGSALAEPEAEAEPLDVVVEQPEPVALADDDAAPLTPTETVEAVDGGATATIARDASEPDGETAPEPEPETEPSARHAAGPVPADDDQPVFAARWMIDPSDDGAADPEHSAPVEERGGATAVAPPAPEPERSGSTLATPPLSSVKPEPEPESVSVSKAEVRAAEKAQKAAAEAQKKAEAEAARAAAKKAKEDAKQAKIDAAKREREAKQAAREAKRRGPQVADVAVEHSMRPGWMPLHNPAVPRPSLGEDGLNKPARATSKINWKVWVALALVLLSVPAIKVRMSTSPDVFTAVCIDNRTMVRESNDYNCQNQRAVYYRWFYVRNGNLVPGVNEQADPGQGSTLPPASNATIIYGFRSDGGVAGKG